MSILLLFFVLASKCSSSSSSSHVEGDEIVEFSSPDQRVNLSVYFESLSEPCATFIIKNLVEIFNKDLINIVNLQLVPWANASISNINNTILCQNGPDECQLNSLEACVLNVSHDVNKHYALIFCFELLALEGRHKKWQSCFNQLGLPKQPFLDCFNAGNGTQLGRDYVSQVARLSPPFTVLPWVLVDDKPLEKDYESFVTYVCKAYKGPFVPPACHLF
ncbi:gamma-interferon-responsive lysosomal thiol protein-like [Prosopis cineraria]|uniref:gamma-interferon-responsive lysosomal thiol protein-like n=1 Tax=Prosopis cineraria TaxID=364024 RepID=UPI00240EB292|nr:gamma-interferon-responsive lysosomal thiol protein-like [Prosopis cineraria]